jgi:chromosome segregation ATPase
MSDQWETFCDVGYYHMWRLRLKNERGWNDGFHINTKAEAEGLCELLNKLEGELNDYRNFAFQSERNLEEAQQQLLVKRSNNRRLDARNKRLEHEIENLKEELESHAWTISPAMAQAKIDELVEQRDRLAEACKLLMSVIGDPTASAEDWWATEDEINAAWNIASKALASVKGGRL